MDWKIESKNFMGHGKYQEGEYGISEKAIVHKVPPNVRKQSIETLKIRKESLEYLRQNGFKIIDDVIERQYEIPAKVRGNIYAYLILAWKDNVNV